MPNAELDNLQRKLDHIIECSLALFCTADLMCNKRVADRHNGQRTHAIFGSQGVKFTRFHIYGQNAVIVHQLQLCIIAVIIKFITGVYAAGMSRDTPYSGELSSLCGQTKIRSRCERNRTEAVVVHIGVGRGRCRDDYVLDVYAFADRAAGANADGSFYAEILHQLCSIDAE